MGLEGRGGEGSLGPQVGGQEAVGVGNSNEGSLEGVLQGSGGTGRRGVDILDTTELQKLLDSRGGNNGRTSGGGDESNVDGSWRTGCCISTQPPEGCMLVDARTPLDTSTILCCVELHAKVH